MHQNGKSNRKTKTKNYKKSTCDGRPNEQRLQWFCALKKYICKCKR